MSAEAECKDNRSHNPARHCDGCAADWRRKDLMDTATQVLQCSHWEDSEEERMLKLREAAARVLQRYLDDELLPKGFQ